MISALAFALVLGIVIGFHEMSHLLVAKLFGVKVIRFSLGFGPVLYKLKLGETEYILSLLPIGGYVMPLSEDVPEEYQDRKNPDKYFESKPAWQRFLIYLAGPVSNLLLSFLLLVGLFYFVGISVPTTTLGEVMKNSPAELAGLKSEDKIITINYEKMSSWEDVVIKIRNHKDEPLNLIVEREDKILSFSLIPKLQDTPEGKRLIIGIVPKFINEKQGMAGSLKLGYRATQNMLKLFSDFLKRVAKLEASRDSMGGVIMIGQSVHEAAKTGVVALIEFLILISMNLFVFNILPIPLLDGGQIYPAFFEMLTGIKPNKKFLMLWQSIGIVLLLSLFVLGFYNDIERLLKK